METRNLASTRTLYGLTHLEWAGAVITVGERISAPQASSYRLGHEVRSPEPGTGPGSHKPNAESARCCHVPEDRAGQQLAVFPGGG